MGYALNVAPEGTDLPWHRVVNAKGQVSPRSNALGHEDLQEHLLRREGVRLTEGTIPLDRFQWRPRR